LTSTAIDNRTGVATTHRNQYAATEDTLARLVLNPNDEVQFRQVYSDVEQGGSVTIAGQVRYPGTYNILRGEHLSSVLMRAGGLTEVAYPYGTVFLRPSVAAAEQVGYTRASSEIRSQLFDVIMRPVSSTSTPMNGDAIVALQSLLAQIQNQPALGRMTVVADPAVLLVHPDHDPLLEPGDSITIPKRPSTINVLGEVMQPGSFLLDNSLSVDDYIERAGGFTEFADRSRVIVVLPDGTAQVADSSWLSFGQGDHLPPGSTIVVARDVSGLSLHQLIIDVTSVTSQLATSAAALAVLSKQ
jgi:protein involved in polysaccharide export with SLBB domain